MDEKSENYIKRITPEDTESINYEIFYKGEKINNVIQIVLDERIK